MRTAAIILIALGLLTADRQSDVCFTLPSTFYRGQLFGWRLKAFSATHMLSASTEMIASSAARSNMNSRRLAHGYLLAALALNAFANFLASPLRANAHSTIGYREFALDVLPKDGKTGPFRPRDSARAFFVGTLEAAQH